MSKKQHFIERRIASSNNYEISRRIRKAYLIRHPEENILEIEQSRTHIKLPFAMICGKRVELSISEADIHTSIKINWE